MHALTIQQALRQAQHTFYGQESAHVDAEILLCHALGCQRSHLYAWPEKPLSPSQQAFFDSLIDRRVLGEPVAYIVGEREFWSLSLHVSPHVLIPRPETELLVETALSLLPESAQRIADLGTGSGAIALALASERPQWRVLATDRSPHALMVASDNATRLGVSNVSFRQGTWHAPLAEECFAMIISNPPYIAPQDRHLQEGDLRFEPIDALRADEAGLADLRHLIEGSPAHLHPGGWLLLEHGFDQGAAVHALFVRTGYADIRTLQDLHGHDRVTLGRWSEEAPRQGI